jgi:hypothetical protein
MVRGMKPLPRQSVPRYPFDDILGGALSGDVEIAVGRSDGERDVVEAGPDSSASAHCATCPCRAPICGSTVSMRVPALP